MLMATELPRVAVVTGGSAGVGRATVRELASTGFDVAVLARGLDGLEGARRDIVSAGRRALSIPVDVADAESVRTAAERIERELGPIDLWINNAMASVFAPFDEISPEEFERVTRVTYLGTVHGTRAALCVMKPRRRGKILQVGSALAYRSIPLQSAYCGAKAAIRGFTDSVRCELLHDRCPIEIAMVQLPAVNTPQFDWVRSRLPRRAQPVPPIFQPEVASRAIVWAATHGSREIDVGGSTLAAVVLGAKLFPGMGDAYLARHAYASQQTDQPRKAGPDNLFAPVAGDHGAHGAFDERATSWSPELWVALYKTTIVTSLLVALGAVAAAAVALGKRVH
jgi:NAD(P)-dependent dehydrogenase (short-subunit alcohol dehydrogenase family)